MGVIDGIGDKQVNLFTCRHQLLSYTGVCSNQISQQTSHCTADSVIPLHLFVGTSGCFGDYLKNMGYIILHSPGQMSLCDVNALLGVLQGAD